MESAYGTCFAHDLRKRGLAVQCQVRFPVLYDGLELEAGYRVDLLIEREVIVENKAAKALATVHEAQLTYLKLSGLRLGFLINWNVPRIRDGIRRMVNHL